MPSSGRLAAGPRELRTLVRFGLAGLLNTAVGFSVVAVLDLGLRLDPQLANAGGYAVGVPLGFVLSRRFVFNSDGHLGRTGAKYLVALAVAFLANQTVLAAARPLFGPASLGRLAAQLTAMASYTLLLFGLCRLWVFRQTARS